MLKGTNAPRCLGTDTKHASAHRPYHAVSPHTRLTGSKLRAQPLNTTWSQGWLEDWVQSWLLAEKASRAGTPQQYAACQAGGECRPPRQQMRIVQQACQLTLRCVASCVRVALYGGYVGDVKVARRSTAAGMSAASLTSSGCL